MSVLLIAGSPSLRSRSQTLLRFVRQYLEARGGAVDEVHVRNLAPQALLFADTTHTTIVNAVEQVARASLIVIATPVYKTAYSGVLKAFLDLLPQSALKDKTVLPIATGGSAHHMLALDYALRPVLQSLAARQILPGVYATDSQVVSQADGSYEVGDEIAARLEEGAANLFSEVARMQPPGVFETVSFSQVRCSV
ncbi:MAG: FMN reductase (NADPH) [Burkholderiales bacterium]|nr:MAG: FMN reductase (NADPH) [Burkholderiales bacterium]TAG78757.1 MAG: FMN reductase (NADPH) [Betaproteobacteria bacterium]